MKKGFLIILVVLCCAEFSFSQDIHFSQISNTPLILNPSLAGYIDGDTRTILNYKDQWRSITVPYKTIAASFDLPLFKNKWKGDYIGLGLSLYNDKAGDAKMGTSQFNFSLAYSRSMRKKSKILLGLQSGWGQRSFDITQLTWDNQYNGSSFDPTLPSLEPASVNNNFSYVDLTAGTAWDYVRSKYFQSILGLSVFHINQPRLHYYDNSNVRLHTKFVVHGGISFIRKNTNMTYKPAFIYFRQGPLQEITFGSMFRYRLQEASHFTGYYEDKSISFGVWYRFKDAIIPCIRYEYDSKYFLEISYDINVSKLSNVSNSRGGFEISLVIITRGGKSKRELIKPLFN